MFETEGTCHLKGITGFQWCLSRLSSLFCHFSSGFTHNGGVVLPASGPSFPQPLPRFLPVLPIAVIVTVLEMQSGKINS